MKTPEAVTARRHYESAALTAELQARSWQYVTLKSFCVQQNLCAKRAVRLRNIDQLGFVSTDFSNMG